MDSSRVRESYDRVAAEYAARIAGELAGFAIESVTTRTPYPEIE